jgi:glycosyltransferase involved in cell wall biosynthesis
MKYPLVLFLRDSKSNSIDVKLQELEPNDFTLEITDDPSRINDLYSEKYNILCTYGTCFNHLINDRIKHKWIPITDLNDFSKKVNETYIQYNLLPRENIRPLFSIFTTCYNSYQKIHRAYNSIKAQTLSDWEWVILDDSPDDKHFDFLRKLSKREKRVRLYKRDFNSGIIGNVKNEAVSLCRGKYIIEMDHDDEILPDVLKDATAVFDKMPEVGFIYMDFINIYENGANFKYTDFLCKGYAGYYCQYYRDQWVYVYMTPNINNVTLSHLTCCPNHPRIWRRKLLMEFGNYSEHLPICDDFEILLRTCVQTKVAKIPKLAYVQYMNDGENNFSLIRNSEINRIGPQLISPMYFKKYNIDDLMFKRGAYEHNNHKYFHSKIWLRKDDYEHKYDNLIINVDHSKQFLLLGLDVLEYHRVALLYANRNNDFLLLDNKGSHKEVQERMREKGMMRMKYYILPDISKDELIAYFMRLYKSCDDYEIID